MKCPQEKWEQTNLPLLQLMKTLHWVNSLKLIHDFSIYHSSIPFNEEDKTALYDVSILWEIIEEM
jgi:hypothetical protein